MRAHSSTYDVNFPTIRFLRLLTANYSHYVIFVLYQISPFLVEPESGHCTATVLVRFCVNLFERIEKTPNMVTRTSLRRLIPRKQKRRRRLWKAAGGGLRPRRERVAYEAGEQWNCLFQPTGVYCYVLMG